MHDTGCLGLVHWDDPEGGYGEGGAQKVPLQEAAWEQSPTPLLGSAGLLFGTGKLWIRPLGTVQAHHVAGPL